MTHEESYAYAVARIRANELSLLSATDIDQLLFAPDLVSAGGMLAAKGYAIDLGLDTALNEKMTEAWQLLTEILPRPEDDEAPSEIGELDFLIVRNDFHNLKARLKSMMKGGGPEAYLMSPTVFNDREVGELLQAGQFGALPECMAVCAREAYELLAGAGGGQMADAVIDRQCLETILAIADTSGSEFIRGLAKNICAFANAKIAMRAEKTGKGQDFLKIALCGCPPAELPEEARQSGAAFEKYCDDALIEYALPAKWVTFGIAPLAAYYLAKEAEVKNVRIVMTCKQNGVPADEIRKRVRRLYV